MTERTNPYAPSPVERATASLTSVLNEAISTLYTRYNVSSQQITEKQFRRIIAGYFTGKNESQWCADLGIDPPESL
jgi:hypothetical protein